MVTKTEKSKKYSFTSKRYCFFAILYFIEGINYSSRRNEVSVQNVLLTELYEHTFFCFTSLHFKNYPKLTTVAGLHSKTF